MKDLTSTHICGADSNYKRTIYVGPTLSIDAHKSLSGASCAYSANQLDRRSVPLISRCKLHASGICFNKFIGAACSMDFGVVLLQVASMTVGSAI